MICCISCGFWLVALKQWQTSETARQLKQLQQQWLPRVSSLILVPPCLHPSHQACSSKQIEMQVVSHPLPYPPERSRKHIKLRPRAIKLEKFKIKINCRDAKSPQWMALSLKYEGLSHHLRLPSLLCNGNFQHFELDLDQWL